MTDPNEVIIEERESLEQSQPVGQIQGNAANIVSSWSGEQQEQKKSELREDEQIILSESSQNIKAIIKEEILEQILSRAFKFINEKKALESKRKTWNLKHQEE